MNKKLIERFYRNECSPDEKGLIIHYLKNHPEESEAYFSETEWELFSGEEMDLEITERMNKVINENIIPKKHSLHWIKKLAVAASFFLLILYAWHYLKEEKHDLKQAAERIVRIPVKTINNTDSILKFDLPDGSLVELFPKSALDYQLPFDSNSRKIFLSGIAKFDVFHDSTKPFTVFSEEIATTALGTSFKVFAEKGREEVKVQLYVGSVVIRNADVYKNNLSMDYYLKPGEVFFYNRTKRISGISNLNEIKKSQNKKRVEEKVNTKLSTELNNWYMFNNQSLAMVFESLQTIYDVKINFDASEINEISFIGRVERADSIENLLNDIAKLNDLRVTKNGKSFSITKK